MFSFFSFTCSLKNLPVPKIEVSTFELSINPADESSSIFGTGKFFKEQTNEKKENIYSNIDDMLKQSLKTEDE